MIRRHRLGFAVAGVVILIVAAGMIAKAKMEEAATMAKFPDRGVPRINIELEGVTLDEINAGSKEMKYEGNGLSLYEGNKVTEFEGVQVKGRGNGTWNQEKKPYQIKFASKVDLFGMGKAKKWILLANAMDTTNLRTAAAVYLEEMLGMKYIFEGKFVELYVDGGYEGLYYLTHAMEIGKNTVDLKDPMGVLVELDNLYWGAEDYRKSSEGDYLVLKDVVDRTKGERAMESFMHNYNEFERAVVRKDYGGVKGLADVRSFAEYYLLSEFSVNPDAYWTSFYFYKDGISDKIHAGPGWDFDLTFANRSWGNWMGESFYSPMQTMVRKGELLPKELYDEMGIEEGYKASLAISKIMYNLMEIPEFREEVKRVYQERLLGRKDELTWKVDSEAEKIAELAEINNEKWEKNDFWTEVETMIRWIGQRYDYFEEEYGG